MIPSHSSLSKLKEGATGEYIEPRTVAEIASYLTTPPTPPPTVLLIFASMVLTSS